MKFIFQIKFALSLQPTFEKYIGVCEEPFIRKQCDAHIELST